MSIKLKAHNGVFLYTNFTLVSFVPKERRCSPKNKIVPSPSSGTPKWCRIGFFAHNVPTKEKIAKPAKINVCFEQNKFLFAPHKMLKHKPIIAKIMCAATKTHSESTHMPILNGGSAVTNSQKLMAVVTDKVFSKIFISFAFFMMTSNF